MFSMRKEYTFHRVGLAQVNGKIYEWLKNSGKKDMNHADIYNYITARFGDSEKLGV